jgi:polyadenylate-binding protein 2
MKQRVKEMEEEAAKLRELQAAAQASESAEGEGTPMETDEDRAAADVRSVYVGNVRSPTLMDARDRSRRAQVDYGATPEELQSHFQACGTINRITILCDKFTGHPKGYVGTFFWVSLRSDSSQVRIRRVCGAGAR